MHLLGMKIHSIGGDSLIVDVIEYGATIVGIRTPDKAGLIENVVLHYDSLASYEQQPAPRAYYGATIGRYANRIANARFVVNGREYRLSANDGPHTLHGGACGFDAAVWRLVEKDPNRVILAHDSPDGDQGFPGKLSVTVTFAVELDTLRIEYRAHSDADTVVNLTNHTYFALDPGRSTPADYELTIAADAYTPVSAELIPTGETSGVEGTRYDFRTPRTIGAELYDTNWVLRAGGDAHGLRQAATLRSPVSGRRVDVHTAQPGLQVYSGNPGGVALETQHFPDSPNHPNFPSTVLRPGDVFRSTTLYRFSLDADERAKGLPRR